MPTKAQMQEFEQAYLEREILLNGLDRLPVREPNRSLDVAPPAIRPWYPGPNGSQRSA